MRRVPELDALRGLAALVVVLHHLGSSNNSFSVPFGWSAVDLFFVLSGYLITSILLRHRPSRQSVLAFVGRRALRIWPVYYLTLAILLLVTPLLPVRYSWDRLLQYLTYTQNIDLYFSVPSARAAQPLLTHSWTLAIEEQFYLVWPLLLVLAGRRRVVPLAVAVALLANAARFAGWSPYVLVSRCDGLALGALLAGLLADPDWANRRQRGLSRGLAAVLVAAVAYLAWFKLSGDGMGIRKADQALLTALNLGYFSLIGLVVCHAGHRALAPLRWGPLCHVGLISYGIYLNHNILINLAYDHARPLGYTYGWVLQATIIPLSIAIAELSWRYFERPLLALKDRLPYAAPERGESCTPTLAPSQPGVASAQSAGVRVRRAFEGS